MTITARTRPYNVQMTASDALQALSVNVKATGRASAIQAATAALTAAGWAPVSVVYVTAL